MKSGVDGAGRGCSERKQEGSWTSAEQSLVVTVTRSRQLRAAIGMSRLDLRQDAMRIEYTLTSEGDERTVSGRS